MIQICRLLCYSFSSLFWFDCTTYNYNLIKCKAHSEFSFHCTALLTYRWRILYVGDHYWIGFLGEISVKSNGLVNIGVLKTVFYGTILEVLLFHYMKKEQNSNSLRSKHDFLKFEVFLVLKIIVSKLCLILLLILHSVCELEGIKQLKNSVLSMFCSFLCSFKLLLDLYHVVSFMDIYLNLKFTFYF